MKYMQYESIHTSSPHRPHTSRDKTRATVREVRDMCGLPISDVYMGNRLQDFHINNKQNYE